MSISGTILFQETHNVEPGEGGRQIVSVMGLIAVPKEQVGLFVKPNQLQIVRGNPAMLSLYLTGERYPLDPQHHGQSHDYMVCQPIWRAP